MAADIPTSPVAIVGVGAIMPGAPDAGAFWQNLTSGRYSITQVPSDRWDPALYYSADHEEPDKTYSTIGGWVTEYPWDPIRWKMPIPPKVAEQMDAGQRWAISAGRDALTDAGWPNWNVDPDNVAVILGNAIGGEKHYESNLRIEMAEVMRDLGDSPSFQALSADQREHIIAETKQRFLAHYGEINEDTMPGELANIIAGRVANLFNFRGPNYTTDAACASSLAAIHAAVEGLVDHKFDAAVTGGIDHNMGVAAFVKFCKIGALSATGSRPFDAGADGFVMGEGAGIFVLKRLEDAERDGDKIYAVILGVAGSSDGKGKGITAPNPVGQKLAVRRAWNVAGTDPSTVSAIEAHGTSTRVGDAAELDSLSEVFTDIAPRSVALGSVKSNIGHLKAAAGAAGTFKMAMSLHHKVLAPSLNFDNPNPNVDWDTSPFAVSTTLREWPTPASGIRRAGVSAFGFGGTNFHVVLEEYVPGRHRPPAKTHAVGADLATASASQTVGGPAPATTMAGGADIAFQPSKPSMRGALFLAGRDDADLKQKVEAALADARAGSVPLPGRPDPSLAQAPVRLACDFADATDLAKKLEKVITALASGNDAIFRLLRQQGCFIGRGPAPKVAFLYTGQGSQYVNMLQQLRDIEPIVADTFAQADEIMTPLLGRTLSSYIFIDGDDPEAVKQLEQQLLQTEITQPAVLATDAALTRLLAAYGITPDMVMGHSLGEYGALIAAGSLTFPAALEAVSARGREMASLSMEDNGAMAAVFGPLTEVERIVDATPGYVVVANINSNNQAVVGGATAAVLSAVDAFNNAGMQAVRIPVSHAFHTSIVAPASEPLIASLRRLDVQPPQLPLAANITGEFYPADATQETMLEYLGRQVASPVQFVKGLHTIYDAGARVFVEVGPKRALHGFVEDVLGDRDDVLALYTNHPKVGDVASVNQALCGLWASGVGLEEKAPAAPTAAPAGVSAPAPVSAPTMAASSVSEGPVDDRIMQLGRLFAGVIEDGLRIYGVPDAPALTAAAPSAPPALELVPSPQSDPEPSPQPGPLAEPVVITGAALGLPGVERVFDDDNIARILDGQQFITNLSDDARRKMADMHIRRLVKSDDGGANFETIDDPADVIKLAGSRAPIDVVAEFAVDQARDEALDDTTRLAIGAGLDALRDAGIPLALGYKTTTIGSLLPDRWELPEELRDDTGVIFGSAFPGYARFAEEIQAYADDRARREQLLALEGVKATMGDGAGEAAGAEVDRLIAEVRQELEDHPYTFDRRFLFRVLSMGHSQFAELIGARGPNTQVNAACSSTTQAVALAEDWIQAGRCRRVIVISADDVTNDSLLPWIGAGFLASGAAATDEDVTEAATPFDRRRHGMILGMGAAALVVESADAAAERGIQPICEVLGSITSNSAFHGTRLNVDHVAAAMEALVAEVEARGIDRNEMAPETMFVSHETYTPARGGSAAAEIFALRRVFGPGADRIVITNTKGMTGHAMGAGIEDVVAVKALETGLVPAVPNYREPDPELGALNLSTGGSYPVRYALRLAAGFGSQIALSLCRWTPMPDGRRRTPDQLGYRSRIVDPEAWQQWLDRLAGHSGAQVEVDHRRLRLVDIGNGAPPKEIVVRVPYADRLAPAAESMIPTAAPVTAPAPAPAPDVTPAPAPEVTPAPAPAAQAPAPVVDDVLSTITDVVAGMTGYPTDLLDPDLDLEADLGVDTVKQAEVFAAVREQFGLERDENLQLRDFPTLRHVSGWVRDHGGLGEAPSAPAAADAVAAPAVAPPVAPSPAVPAADVAGDDVLATVTDVVAGMTGYPVELLDPELDLEADLGVDTVKQAEVFAAVRDHYGVERDDSLQLRDFPTLNHVAGWIRDRAGLGAAPSTDGTGTAAATSTAAPATDIGGDGSGDPVLAAVTGVVAGMTGYPVELLDPELDLEADLGVDTVKQAEVFAAVRERYGVERDDSLQLRDFPTLNHVAGWIRDRAGIVDAGPTATVTAEAGDTDSAPPPEAPDLVAGDFDAVDALPRRLPVSVIRPSIEVCVPTGVDLDGARVVVMMDEGGVGSVLVEHLERAGATVLALEPAVETDTLLSQLESWQGDGPITGVYWLAGVDPEGDLTEFDLGTWREALRRRVKNLYETMRAGYEAEPFLVSGVRLGGYHGYDDDGATNPLGGAVVGFTKSYKKERPDSLVKAVDVTDDAEPEAVASVLLEETLHDPGCVEVGRVGDQRTGVALRETPFPDRDEDGEPPQGAGMEFDSDSVFLVTGAAGSIVSAITADLAAASGGVFHLLDLTPTPDADDPDLQAFRHDRDGLKATIAERMKAAGDRPTPVAIERDLSRYERLDAALAAVQSVEAAGGTVHYHSVDLTDAEAVAEALANVAETSGRIDVLLHAAGLEISRNLPDKERREYDLVFDVKADGWFNVFHAARHLPIGATVVFSSVAGRFGNQGQTDYSAANDLLCKITSNLRRSRPDTRAIALDWTAWGGIGMATRGSIPKIMEMAGVQMLPPEAGVAWIRRELTGSRYRGEVVVAGTLGMMAAEYHDTGGVDSDALMGEAAGPMVGSARLSVHDGVVVETSLDPSAQPFLDDHRIDGTPVLPGVMGLEAFAETARLVAPGYQVIAVEDVSFAAPLKFYRDEPRSLTVTALVQPDGKQLVARCRLVAERKLPGQDQPQRTVHFTGTVRLASRSPRGEERAVPGDPPGAALDADGVYSFYFHGPAYQVVERAWRDDGTSVAALTQPLPPNHIPADQTLVIAPRLIELCFQTAGLWLAGSHGQLGLPSHIGRVRLMGRSDRRTDDQPRWAVAEPVGDDRYTCTVIDGDANVILVLEDYRTIQLPTPIPDDIATELSSVYGD